MSCDKVEGELLQDYLEGTIDPLEQLFLETHLSVCGQCRRELSQLKLAFWELNDKKNYETEFPEELEEMGTAIADRVLGEKTKSTARKVRDVQVHTMKMTGDFLGRIPGAKQTPKILRKASKKITKGITNGLSKSVKKLLEAK